MRLVINQPFAATQTEGAYDTLVNVNGGGVSGQAGAIRHGISRALLEVDPDFRGALKRAGLLTRDARMVERKKNQVSKRPVKQANSQNVNQSIIKIRIFKQSLSEVVFLLKYISIILNILRK